MEEAVKVIQRIDASGRRNQQGTVKEGSIGINFEGEACRERRDAQIAKKVLPAAGSLSPRGGDTALQAALMLAICTGCLPTPWILMTRHPDTRHPRPDRCCIL